MVEICTRNETRNVQRHIGTSRGSVTPSSFKAEISVSLYPREENMSSAIRLHSDGTSTRTSTLGVNTHLQFPYRDRTAIWWRPFLINPTALRHCILDEVHSKPSTSAWALLSGSSDAFCWGLFFFFLNFPCVQLLPPTLLTPRPQSGDWSLGRLWCPRDKSLGQKSTVVACWLGGSVIQFFPQVWSRFYPERLRMWFGRLDNNLSSVF